MSQRFDPVASGRPLPEAVVTWLPLDPGSFRTRTPAPSGLRIVEAQTERAAGAALHARLREVAAEAVRGAAV
jgi:hypothetical protein